MLWRSSHISVLSLILWCSTRSVAQNLTDDQISLVKQRLAEGATHSWEYGTRAQSLLELDASGFSVLSPVSLPPPTSLNSTANSSLSDVFAIAQNIVGNRAKSNKDATGPQPLINDSSAGDPCSIGVAVLLANWTGLGAVDGLDYAGAATDQLNFLWSDSVPKTSDGAFSHRVEQVQLWADSVYMVPPFLAYYGVLSQNRSLVEEAYNQIKLYRNYLNDNSANGLWKHIQLGSSIDDGHWSTGNAWATAGMLRVLGTMKNSQYANSFKNEIKDLTNWAFDIQSAMYPLLQSSGLFKNYADSNASNNFDDASSTAMMAATVYRMSLLTGKHTYLPDAERSRKALSSLTGSSSSSLARRQDPSQSQTESHESTESRASSQEASSASGTATAPASRSATSSATPTPTSNAFQGAAHFDADGWLAPVVNPLSFPDQGAHSPEAQAFVLEMQAAWRDWVADGAQGANAAARVSAGTAAWAVVLGASVLMAL